MNANQTKQNSRIDLSTPKVLVSLNMILVALAVFLTSTLISGYNNITFLIVIFIGQAFLSFSSPKTHNAKGFGVFGLVVGTLSILALGASYLLLLMNLTLRDHNLLVLEDFMFKFISLSIVYLAVFALTIATTVIYSMKTFSQKKPIAQKTSTSGKHQAQDDSQLVREKLKQAKEMLDKGLIEKEHYNKIFQSVVFKEEKTAFAPPIDPQTEKINKLKQMLADGIISKEEYQKILLTLLT